MTETPGMIAREFLRLHSNQAWIELDVAAGLLAQRIHEARQSPFPEQRWNLGRMEAEFSALTRARQVLRVVAAARSLTARRRALPDIGLGLPIPAKHAAKMAAEWRLELLALGRRIAALTALVNV